MPTRHANGVRRRRIGATAVVLFVALTVLPPTGWSQTPGEETPTDPAARLDVLGTFKRFPADLEKVLGEKPKTQPPDTTPNVATQHGGWPFFDITNRRIFQLYEVESGGVAMTIRDLDSFKGVGVVKIPEYKTLGPPGFPGFFPDTAIEVDEKGKRLFLWNGAWNGQDVAGVVVVEWDRKQPRYRFTEVPVPDGQVTTFGAHLALTISSLTYVPSEDKLYIRNEADPSNVAQNVTTLVQMDASLSDRTQLELDWTRRLRSCRSGPTIPDKNSGEVGVLWEAEERSLFLPCNPGAATAVIRVPVSEAGLPVTEESFAGIGFGLDYLIDSDGGRIHIKTTSGPSGLAILTFDVRRKAYVGLSALQDPPPDANAPSASTPMAVDRSSGRVFALSDAAKYGLTMLEGRLSPVPPGRQFPQARFKQGRYPPPSIRFDPNTRRIFVPRRMNDESTGDFLILKDLPPATAPTEFDVDTLTTDIEDDEGVTTLADYSGGASGYGVRLLLAGGARGAPPVSFFEGIPPDYGKSPCRATDRDLIFGRTDRTFLSSAGRAAAAIAVDADTATRSDLSEPSRCKDENPPDTVANSPVDDAMKGPTGRALWALLTDPAYAQMDRAGRPWAFRRTECPVPNEDGTTRDKDTASGAAPFVGSTSSVDCLPKKAQIVASSIARLPLPGAPVTFGDAASFTEIVRDPKRGLVSRSIAYVRDIDIAGVVQIDGVYAVAESYATGRPQKSNKIGAGTKYIRGVTGFTSPGYSCGHEGEDACGDPSALIDGVNRAFVNVGVQLRFPPVEPDLAAGTPGGYQAGIQREFFNSLNAEFANGDILKEVPALEIVRTNDSKNWGRQRQIYQFAGVLANSQYGIRSMGDGFAPPPTSGSTDPVPADEQVLGGAVDGLAPAGSAPTLSTTGGSTALPPALPGPSTGGAVAVPESLGRRITEGLSFLMRDPKTAGLMVGAWILLLLPGALAYRRRLLMNAVTSTGRGTS